MVSRQTKRIERGGHKHSVINDEYKPSITLEELVDLMNKINITSEEALLNKSGMNGTNGVRIFY